MSGRGARVSWNSLEVFANCFANQTNDYEAALRLSQVFYSFVTAFEVRSFKRDLNERFETR